MTLPLATAVLLASLGVLVALLAPQAPRVLRQGTLPARPRRVWVTLLVAREIGTAGAATAAAWLALAAPGPLPPWAAAALAGAAAFLVAEGLAPALGLLLPDAGADRLAELASRLLAVLRRPLERPAVVLAGWLAGEGGLPPASVLRFAADGRVEEGEEAALDERGRQLLARVRALGLRPVRAVMTPRMRIAALPVDTGGAALLAALREQRFSRVPVYRGERDNVVGVLYAKDLLGRDVSAPGFRLEPFLRPPAFV
ncbi:MAG TPA: CBS domain-containing protein, partial [Verrucomicrobiae bacterium]|nr:CBS domain-containing protein [Verrucomicrobiae bacterium]